MVSEKEQEEIRKEAKRILDNFASALGKTKVKEKRLKRDVGGFREEKGKDEAIEKVESVIWSEC